MLSDKDMEQLMKSVRLTFCKPDSIWDDIKLETYSLPPELSLWQTHTLLGYVNREFRFLEKIILDLKSGYNPELRVDYTKV